MSLNPKPKTPQQLEELIELFREQAVILDRCDCFKCKLSLAVYDHSIDTILYALGQGPKDFSKLVQRLKSKRVGKTEGQCSHSE